jgi:hypothetical protein
VVAAVGECTDLPFARDGAVDADVIVLDLYLGDGRPAVADITRLSAKRPVLVISASRSPPTYWPRCRLARPGI